MRRFWEKVDRSGDCWVWTASLVQGSGYGQFRVGDKVRKAHVVAYEMMVGPVPDALTLDHVCRNRACVNPSHLEPVPLVENLARAPTNPTTINAMKTHCIHGHEFTPENTEYRRRRGGRIYRRCRECGRRSSRDRGRRLRSLSDG